MGFWCNIVVLFILLLVASCCVSRAYAIDDTISNVSNNEKVLCDEIYQVKEGETLHSISDKCNDPFILENNPHVQQHDDVFPGLVIRISRNLLA
ncbi:hypothetical protein PHJA_001995900 [Phtheirospermum japonicum]|uniref:LysM domain-containing protein n=1 Tax=Phtheirospermum japonicum TaxID=374723 RepID=A0A830CFS8_9LAMI|nr:hypothetical protein PHJA_001995900 [Phtheirospermum japonicum]